mmetsp:Transcript_12397/g.30448  ORF Transcript_12397/g.30448 Transcript_12397/m.30448 type:complete len:203 (+) Transcript_12397:689-1297(+)
MGTAPGPRPGFDEGPALRLDSSPSRMLLSTPSAASDKLWCADVSAGWLAAALIFLTTADSPKALPMLEKNDCIAWPGPCADVPLRCRWLWGLGGLPGPQRCLGPSSSVSSSSSSPPPPPPSSGLSAVCPLRRRIRACSRVGPPDEPGGDMSVCPSSVLSMSSTSPPLLPVMRLLRHAAGPSSSSSHVPHWHHQGVSPGYSGG